MWNKIKSIPGCKTVRVPGTDNEMYLLPVPDNDLLEPSFWLIGEYRVQTPFATKLRDSETLQKFVTKHRVRFGLRESDRPPKGERQVRFGTQKLAAKPGDFTQDRVQQLAVPVKEDEASVNRRTDRELNVQTFWATQTPQSHHIVEFNNLRDIGKSKESGSGELDHGQLPCVLLAAEFHQRYISSILKKLHGASKKDLLAKLPGEYSALYLGRGPLFSPLWSVSRIILQAAGLPVA
jgi:hypothetical protein